MFGQREGVQAKVRAPAHGHAPVAHGRILAVFHQLLDVLNAAHRWDNQSLCPQIQQFEYGGTGDFLNPHKGGQIARLGSADHVGGRLNSNGGVLLIDDYIIHSGQRNGFHHQGASRVEKGAQDPLAPIQLFQYQIFFHVPHPSFPQLYPYWNSGPIVITPVHMCQFVSTVPKIASKLFFRASQKLEVHPMCNSKKTAMG